MAVICKGYHAARTRQGSHQSIDLRKHADKLALMLQPRLRQSVLVDRDRSAAPPGPSAAGRRVAPADPPPAEIIPAQSAGMPDQTATVKSTPRARLMLEDGTLPVMKTVTVRTCMPNVICLLEGLPLQPALRAQLSQRERLLHCNTSDLFACCASPIGTLRCCYQQRRGCHTGVHAPREAPIAHAAQAAPPADRYASLDAAFTAAIVPELPSGLPDARMAISTSIADILAAQVPHQIPDVPAVGQHLPGHRCTCLALRTQCRLHLGLFGLILRSSAYSTGTICLHIIRPDLSC